VNQQSPLPRRIAAKETLRSVANAARFLIQRRLRHLSRYVGRRLHFANGTSARIYRETIVDGAVPSDPCVLIVAFRLRFVRGKGHALFRAESWLNTPLFVAYPGFVSKLWLAHDERGIYRGVYQWDGPDRAEHYARSLWRVLNLGCEPDSIAYIVLPGLDRDALVSQPCLADSLFPAERTAWWRLVGPP
jgi:hypothetical protein